MNKIRQTASKHITLPEMIEAWVEATSRPRADWELPVRVARAIDQNYAPNPIADAVMAAVGCHQIAIILVDDILDDDPKGSYRVMGVGKAANLALAFQSLAGLLVAQLDAPGEQVARLMAELCAMSLRTAVGQHQDASQSEWSEEAYWQVVEAKSVPFYSHVMALGAVLAGRYEMVDTFRAIGRIVGEMIQIRDDLVDIMAVPAAPDWAHGGNLLLIYARQSEDLHAAQMFEGLVRSVAFGNEALNEAQQWLISDGAVEYCADLLEAKRRDAMGILDMSGVGNHQPIQELLDKLVNQITRLLEN